jgi:hypothetical protein
VALVFSHVDTNLEADEASEHRHTITTGPDSSSCARPPSTPARWQAKGRMPPECAGGESRAVLEDGHTFGLTADEKIRISHRPSCWKRPGRVIHLEWPD